MFQLMSSRAIVMTVICSIADAVNVSALTGKLTLCYVHLSNVNTMFFFFYKTFSKIINSIYSNALSYSLFKDIPTLYGAFSAVFCSLFFNKAASFFSCCCCALLSASCSFFSTFFFCFSSAAATFSSFFRSFSSMHCFALSSFCLQN